MEKVRPWCGQPWDRGRLKNRNRNEDTMGVNSLPKTVTRQRRDSDLNPGPSVPESSTLTTRLPSHPSRLLITANNWSAQHLHFLSHADISRLARDLFLWIGPGLGRSIGCHGNVPCGSEKLTIDRSSTAIVLPTVKIWRRSVG